MRTNRTTGSGGIKLPDVRRRRRRGRGAGVRRTLRALGRLARARQRMEHVPTRLQVRAMAHFDGREPSSYLLDPKVNFVPELPLGDADPLGRHALSSPVNTPAPAAGPSWWRCPTAARSTCSA